jgi:hypothetical protein
MTPILVFQLFRQIRKMKEEDEEKEREREIRELQDLHKNSGKRDREDPRRRRKSDPRRGARTTLYDDEQNTVVYTRSQRLFALFLLYLSSLLCLYVSIFFYSIHCSINKKEVNL